MNLPSLPSYSEEPMEVVIKPTRALMGIAWGWVGSVIVGGVGIYEYGAAGVVIFCSGVAVGFIPPAVIRRQRQAMGEPPPL